MWCLILRGFFLSDEKDVKKREAVLKNKGYGSFKSSKENFKGIKLKRPGNNCIHIRENVM